MIRDKEFLESAKAGPRRAGRKELIAHLEGRKLTRSQAIKGKCFDCCGMGDQAECDIEHCSLYPFSPFKNRGLVKSTSPFSNNEGTIDKTINFKAQNSVESI